MERAYFCLACFVIATKIAINSSKIGLFVFPPVHLSWVPPFLSFLIPNSYFLLIRGALFARSGSVSVLNEGLVWRATGPRAKIRSMILPCTSV
jgi:hypothetical protein